MVRLTSSLVAGLAGLASVVSAHPGHDVKAEAAERAAALKNAPVHARGLSQCANNLKARGFEKSNVARRDLAVQNLRKKRGLEARAPFLKARDTSPLNMTHHATMDATPSTDPSVLFASNNATCVLAEDVTQGPYYVTGELIRSNLVEDQEGVPLFMDIQLIDTNTCEPVPDIYIDFWHCNATGVYSGVQASGNGNSDDSSNLDATFLRGLQKTDKEGVAYFESIFPGHYTSRATHIHVLSHPANETKVNPNDTISGLYTSHSSHVGQIFFDQDLITEVEKNSPYSTNTQEVTDNSDDSILLQELESNIDPFVEYVYLGDSAADGVFAWISVGIDPSVDTDVSPAAYYTGDGGVENEDSSMGGMGGGGGAPPSASSASSSASASASA